MAETVYLHEADDIIRVMERNNNNLIDALTSSLNNLAKNTGNKTIKEYNELKTKYDELEKKYEELEKKYKKSDSLLKSIITMYTLVVFNYNRSDGPLNSDKVVEIIDRTYDDIQKHQTSYMPDVLYNSIIDTGNEVYEKLIRR